MKNLIAISAFSLIIIILHTGCKRSESKSSESQQEVFLKSWNTVEKDGVEFIRIVGTNGVEAAIPSRGNDYGLTLANAEELLKKHNVFNHIDLYDAMTAHGIKGAELRAADALCWDLHARTLDLPLHAVIGTRRDSCIRYGDVRWTEKDTPKTYAGKVKKVELRAAKLHIPGAAKPQSFAPDHHRLTVSQVVEYLKTVREECPDLILAYDPHPQIAAAEHIDSARIILRACELYDYKWIEAPLPLDKKYWPDYKKLRKEFDVSIQNEEEPISYGEFLEWVKSGAVDQICPAVYTHTDFGLTPAIRMIKWVQDNPEKNITINLHYTSIEHTHLAFTMTDGQMPYFEAAYTGNHSDHFRKVNLYEKCAGPNGMAIAPTFPGIYDIPWLNE